MTRAEFIGRLNSALSSLDEKERTDIIMDYAEHFDAGMVNGRTQEEIAEKLGSPEDLAATFLEQRGAGAPVGGYRPPTYGSSKSNVARTHNTTEYNPPSYNHKADDPYDLSIVARRGVAIAALIFTAIFFLPVGAVIFAVVAAVWCGAASLLAAAVVLCIGTIQLAGIQLAGMLCVITGLIGLSFVFGALAVIITRSSVRIIKWFIHGIKLCITTGEWSKKDDYREDNVA